MSIYNTEPERKPPGYYADPEVKARHDNRRVESPDERRFSELVEAELESMGLDSETDIPTREQVETAEENARRKF